MEYRFETAYNQEALTVMAKALRKTVRKKRSHRSHILGTVVVILALMLTVPFGDKEFVLEFKTILTWFVAAVLIFTLIFEDKINGYVARKRMLPGLDKSLVVFGPDCYNSETPLGKSEFKYNNIIVLAETEKYFVFVFSQSHAQVYDKTSISGGTIDDFREFIKSVTGLEMQRV